MALPLCRFTGGTDSSAFVFIASRTVHGAERLSLLLRAKSETQGDPSFPDDLHRRRLKFDLAATDAGESG